MSTTTLFEKTLQGYQARLEEDSSASFQLYCREVNVDHKAMQHCHPQHQLQYIENYFPINGKKKMLLSHN